MGSSIRRLLLISQFFHLFFIYFSSIFYFPQQTCHTFVPRSKWASRVEPRTRIVYFEHADSGALRWTLPDSLRIPHKPKPKPKPKAAPTAKPKFKSQVPTRNNRAQPAPVLCVFDSHAPSAVLSSSLLIHKLDLLFDYPAVKTPTISTHCVSRFCLSNPMLAFVILVVFIESNVRYLLMWRSRDICQCICMCI